MNLALGSHQARTQPVTRDSKREAQIDAFWAILAPMASGQAGLIGSAFNHDAKQPSVFESTQRLSHLKSRVALPT